MQEELHKLLATRMFERQRRAAELLEGVALSKVAASMSAREAALPASGEAPESASAREAAASATEFASVRESVASVRETAESAMQAASVRESAA